jgi:putative toxin-antitoxin system antitoxin component (TIGR02293 family)
MMKSVIAMPLEELAGLLGLRRRPERPFSPFEIIERIQNGLPIAALDRISHGLAPSDANFKYLIVPRATLARRKKRRENLSVDESDRVVRLVKIWVFARDVWGGDDAARAFLFRPHMILEGHRPIDVALATDIGARLVEDILGRLKYGSAA